MAEAGGLPTHVVIDGAAHLITKIDEHADGPHHTHRVHVACGMTVDVDIGGEKESARAVQRANEHHDPVWRDKHASHSAHALNRGEQWHHKRWVDHKSKAEGCDHCVAVETGAAMSITHETAHTPVRQVQADIPTGLPCPDCGSPLYIRYKTGTVGCTARGHDFKVEDVLATGMGLLHKLATGQIGQQKLVKE